MALILATGNYTPPDLVNKVLSSVTTINTTSTAIPFVYVDAVDNLTVVVFKDTGVLENGAVGRVARKGSLNWLGFVALMAGIAFFI